MIEYFAAIILALLALLLVVLKKIYYFFPARELKRQARTGDRQAERLYRAVAYGSSLRLLLWTLIGILLATSFTLLSAIAPTWLVFVALLALIWYGFAWTPRAAVGGFGIRLATSLSPVIAKLLYYLHPLLHGIDRFVVSHRLVSMHTGLYERDDLVELIERQRDVHGNRIEQTDLNLVLHALTFGDKIVQTVMVPRRQVKTVGINDQIGPILMDELYDSQFSRFPVMDEHGEQLVGILYLRDLVATKHSGSIGDVMRSTIHYVHEEQSLYQVLHAFIRTKQHSFVVLDSDEEYVGFVTIEDIMEQIIGHQLDDDFDYYDLDDMGNR